MANIVTMTIFVSQIDPSFSPVPNEERVVFGMKLKQRRNDCVVNESLFHNVVSRHKNVTLGLNYIIVIT